MSEEKALVAIEQRTVTFYDDEIPVVLVEKAGGSQVYVPVRPICDFLNVDWSAQYRRIGRDAVLSDELTPCVVVTATQGQPDQRRELQCLPLEFINGFLFGINANRVKEEVRERLIRYQRECYQVLAEAFLRPDTGEQLSPNQTALAQIRQMGLAIARVADELMVLEQRTTTTEERLDKAAQYMGQVNRRLQVLERRIAPGEELTEEQAFEIKERVTQIALEMARHDPGKSHFAEVYRSLSLETKRTSYKDIPQSAYEGAISFLDDWLRALQTDEKE